MSKISLSSILLGGLLIFLVNCVISCHHDIKIKPDNSIHIKVSRPFAPVPISQEIIPYHSYFCLQSLIDKSLKIYEIDSNNNVRISIIPASIIRNSLFFQIYVKNYDSIFILDYQQSSIECIDFKGDRLFYDSLREGSPTINPDNMMRSDGSDLYFYNTDKFLNVQLDDDRREYYQNVHPVYQFSYKSRNQPNEILWGFFPIKYLKNGSDYCNYFPTICPISQNQSIISYTKDDSIYLYSNRRKISAINCKSRYINQFKQYPDKMQNDMSFYKDYQALEPKYIDFIKNNINSKYYRVAKHRFTLKKGNLMNENDMKWSIMSLDRNFKLLNEVIFDYRFYSPELIIPCRDGLFISKTQNSLDKPDELVLSLFKL